MASSIARIYRRLRFGEPVVVVSGLPRSGTSMLMKMLEAGGLRVVTDGQRTADEDNPKGYYEVERIKFLAKETDKSYVRDARGRVIKVISYLLKYLPTDLNYRVVFSQRNVDEVLASQSKMLERRGEKDTVPIEKMRELTEGELFKAKYLLEHSPQFESVVVQYTDLVGDPREWAHRLNQFLGGKLNEEAMAAVVDPKLYRNRAPGKEAAR